MMAAESSEPGAFSVPREFVGLAQAAIRRGVPEGYDLLYRLLWRLGAEPDLLRHGADPEVARLRRLVGEPGNPVRGRVIPQAAPPAERRIADMTTPAEPSRRVVRAAQKVARDGAYGMDAPVSLEDVAAGVDVCRRCDLWRDATQGVTGEGAAHARLMLVGEQPGDQEDRAGRPFVGPAGQVLDRALGEAGVPRDRAYVTNAVKHFKHELRGKRRIHQTPKAGEIQACRWWLDAERRLVRPRVIVALGATAALAVFGKPTAIAANRGKALQLADQAQGVVTYHPSFLLRVPDEETRAKAYAAFVADLKLAWDLAG
jgi:DNA polymerase